MPPVRSTGNLLAVLLTMCSFMGCSGETGSESTATQLESLRREVLIRQNSLAAVEEKLKDPRLSNLKDSLERTRDKYQSEIESLEREIELLESGSKIPPDGN